MTWNGNFRRSDRRDKHSNVMELSYRRGIARRSKLVEILSTAAQLYEKSHLKMLAAIRWDTCDFLLVACSNNDFTLSLSKILPHSQCTRPWEVLHFREDNYWNYEAHALFDSCVNIPWIMYYISRGMESLYGVVCTIYLASDLLYNSDLRQTTEDGKRTDTEF